MACENAPTLFIFPGLPKTGTTFLERHVFSGLPRSRWSFNDPGVVEAARAVAFAEQDIGSPNLAKAVCDAGAERALLSYDALCGDPYKSFRNRAIVIERLARSCDGLSVKILLMVRRQADWIESIFRQSLHEYYFRPFRRCIVWPEDGDKNGYPRFSVSEFDWSAISRDLANAFGKDSVTVLPYELFVHEPDVFFFQLSEFLETPIERPLDAGVVNRGYGALSIFCALILNPLLREKSRFGFLPNRPFYHALKARRHQRGYGRLFRLSAKLSLRTFLQRTVDRFFWTPARLFDATEKERVMTICAEGNRRLSEYCPVDLTRLGYRTSLEAVDASGTLEDPAKI